MSIYFLIMSIYFYIFLYCVVFATDFCSHFLLVDTDPRSSLQQQGIETKKASQTESCRKSQVIGRAMWCAENISTDGSAKFENENSRNMSTWTFGGKTIQTEATTPSPSSISCQKKLNAESQSKKCPFPGLSPGGSRRCPDRTVIFCDVTIILVLSLGHWVHETGRVVETPREFMTTAVWHSQHFIAHLNGLHVRPWSVYWSCIKHVPRSRRWKLVKNPMNQEMNPENPPQNAVPGLRLGFPSVKGIFLQRCLFLTIQASGAKTPGRDGRLQGHFVIPDLYFIQVHPGAFAESWLVLQHWLILHHFPEAHCSATNQFPLDGPKYLFSHGWQLNAQRQQKCVVDASKSTLFHHLLKAWLEPSAEFLPLSPLCELLHTAALLQSGNWTARCEPRWDCTWCFHVLQCFINFTWAAHVLDVLRVMISRSCKIKYCICIYIHVYTYIYMH